MFGRFALVVTAIALPVFVLASQSEPLPPIEEWLGQDTLVVLKVEEPKAVLDVLLDPAWHEDLKEIPEIRGLLESPQFNQFVGIVRYIEMRLATDWESALRTLAGDEVTIALGPKGRAMIIVDCDDAGLLNKLHQILLEHARDEARRRGDPDRVASKVYRGVTGWTFSGGEEVHALIGRRLVVSNNGDWVKELVDRRADKSADCLAKAKWFQAARQATSEASVATMCVNLAQIKELPRPAKLLRDPENPLGVLLAAELPEAITSASWLAVGLTVEGRTITVQVRTDGRLPEPDHFASFALGGDARGALPNLQVPGRLAAFSLSRDLAKFYRGKDELFPDRTSGLIFFENMMGIFFTGRHFSEEVLPHLSSEIRLVVAQQTYDPEVGTPTIQIPAFALVFRMRHPEKFAVIMEEAWQKALGLINFTRGQQAQPGLLLDRAEHAGVRYTVAAFSAADVEDRQNLDVRFNFSPTLVCCGAYLIMSSTEALARQLIDAVREESQKDVEPIQGVHTIVEMDGEGLHQILQANRESLIRQNMVEKGHSRDQAEAEVGLLLALISLFKGATLELGAQDGSPIAEMKIALSP